MKADHLSWNEAQTIVLVTEATKDSRSPALGCIANDGASMVAAGGEGGNPRGDTVDGNWSHVSRIVLLPS